MDAIFSKILNSYKKANKSAKERMLAKYGFTSEEAFLAHLNAAPNLVQSPVAGSAPTEEEKPLDMVIAFDTTGSMRSYIVAVRKHVEELLRNMFSKTKNLRMKIVAFGDYCDSADLRFQYSQITDNQNELIEFVKKAKNTGGGDADEFYEYVIKRVVEETDWRKDAQKSFLLIGDASPHPVGYSYGKAVKNNQIDWRLEANKAFAAGIQIDTLRIHKSQQWYKELSDITNGVCMEFANADKISIVVEGLAYVRSSKAEYNTVLSSVMKSDDEELKGAFKSISKKLL